MISHDSSDYPHQLSLVYRVNEDVDHYNKCMLNKLASVTRKYEIKANDAFKGQTKHRDLSSLSTKRAETGVLKIACGGRVMLTTNVDVLNSNNDVTTVLVKFDDERIGVKAVNLVNIVHGILMLYLLPKLKLYF